MTATPTAISLALALEELAALRAELAQVTAERDAHLLRLNWIGATKPLISRRQSRTWYVLPLRGSSGIADEFLTAVDKAMGANR